MSSIFFRRHGARCPSLALLIACGAAPALGVAADADLGDLVVTATREAQQMARIPAAVTVIDRATIETSGAAQVPDLLRTIPGVQVRDLFGNGNGQSVDIGGFGETADRHVAVAVNGRVVNPIDMNGISWSTIPLANIERVEVLHGPGSVLYGDNAVGGVVNIITRRANDPGLRATGEVEAGSFDSSSLQAGLDYVGENFGLNGGASRQLTDGYRDRSAADSDHLFLNLWADPTDRVSLSLDLSRSDADYEFPGSLSQADYLNAPRSSTNPSDEGSGRETNATGGVGIDLGTAGELQLEAGHRSEERVAHMVTWGSWMSYDVTTHSFTPRYVLNAPLAGRENRLTLGLDLYDIAYDSTVTGWTPGVYDFNKRSTALYLQDELDLRPDLTLNLGARRERPEYDLRSTTLFGGAVASTMDEAEWAWNLGLAWRPVEGMKLHGRLARAFRYPKVDEFVSLWNGAFNPNLRQETALHREIGLAWRGSYGLGVEARGYRIDTHDEIAFNPATFLNENLDETRHQGVELNLDYAAQDNLRLFGGIAWQHAEFTTGANDGRRVPLVPRYKGSVGAEYRPLPGLLGRLTYTYVGESVIGGDYANQRERLEGYGVLDLHLSYGIGQGVTLFLDGGNLLDEHYAELAFDYGWGAGYYPMPERNLAAGVRVEFR